MQASSHKIHHTSSISLVTYGLLNESTQQNKNCHHGTLVLAILYVDMCLTGWLDLEKATMN